MILTLEQLESRTLLAVIQVNDFTNGGVFGAAFGEVDQVDVPLMSEPGERVHTIRMNLRQGDAIGVGRQFTGGNATALPDRITLRSLATGEELLVSEGPFGLPDNGFFSPTFLQLAYVIEGESGEFEIEFEDDDDAQGVSAN